MKITSLWLWLAWASAVSALTLGLAACAPSERSAQPDAQTTAQSPDLSMPGMSHDAAMHMSLGPKDENFDLRFIDAMIPHHQGGVEMAQAALTHSQRPEIKQLAQQIIDAQTQEISELQTWRKSWYPSQSETPVMYDTNMGHMMPMTQEMRDAMMMSGDLGSADAQFDLRFLNAMMPHHQGAIDMAKQASQTSDRAEIKALAETIISSQQQEIDQMQQWRKAWYGQ